MKSLKEYILEELLFEEMEDLLESATKKDDPTKVGGVTNNTKGVLHELLVGKHLSGGKHMEMHHLINDKTGKKETPEEAHDRLKSQIHPDDYKRISDNAASAAAHIKAHLASTHPGHEISHVHHTSKAGDTEKETGVAATQKEDSSDIYITTKHPKTGKLVKHGISLKVSDKSSKNIPSSSLGMESAGEKGRDLYKEHQNKIKASHPELKSLSNKDSRKEWAEKNPEKHAAIKKENAKLLHSVASAHAKELQDHIKAGNHEHIINHIRDVLAAKKTPAEKEGKATFIKHTTYKTAKGAQHHVSDPGKDHEHILNDHKNISVESSGGSVHFYHTDPKTGVKKKFASQAHKFDSQSDPLSPLKSAGKAV
jgi:hypothetical protein